MKTRIFTFLMALLCLPVVSWGQDTKPSDMNGDGTAISPFELDSADDLKWFQTQIDKEHTDYCAILTADIDLNPGFTFNADGSYEPSTETPYEWTTIAKNTTLVGYQSKMYNGTFNGNGHTISGLYINQGGYTNKALFAGISSDGIVQNVGIVNSYVNGGTYVGAICGTNEGTIKNCYNTGIVVSTDVNANIIGGAYVGGICGYNKNGSMIENCYNTGFIQSIAQIVGGICGYNMGTIRNSYNTHDVTALGADQDREGDKVNASFIGGICGYNYSTIENCFNTGKPISGDGKISIGGICGSSSSSKGVLSNNGYLEGTATHGIGNAYSGTQEEAKSMTAQELVDAMNKVFSSEEGWKSDAVYDEETGTILFPTFEEREEQPTDPEEPEEPEGPVIPDYPKYYNICVEECEGAMVETSTNVVREGNSVTFTIDIAEGYDAENMVVKFKRSLFGYWETATPDADGTYQIRNIYTDIYIMVEGVAEETPTGIEQIEGAQVYTRDGSLFIQTPQPEQVLVISASGAILKNERFAGLRQFDNLSRGVYIICIGNERFKVRI